MITGRILATTCTFVVRTCTGVVVDAAADEEREGEAAVVDALFMVVLTSPPSPLLEPTLFAGDLTR